MHTCVSTHRIFGCRNNGNSGSVEKKLFLHVQEFFLSSRLIYKDILSKETGSTTGLRALKCTAFPHRMNLFPKKPLSGTSLKFPLTGKPEKKTSKVYVYNICVILKQKEFSIWFSERGCHIFISICTMQLPFWLQQWGQCRSRIKKLSSFGFGQ